MPAGCLLSACELSALSFFTYKQDESLHLATWANTPKDAEKHLHTGLHAFTHMQETTDNDSPNIYKKKNPLNQWIYWVESFTNETLWVF